MSCHDGRTVEKLCKFIGEFYLIHPTVDMLTSACAARAFQKQHLPESGSHAWTHQLAHVLSWQLSGSLYSTQLCLAGSAVYHSIVMSASDLDELSHVNPDTSPSYIRIRCKLHGNK